MRDEAYTHYFYSITSSLVFMTSVSTYHDRLMLPTSSHTLFQHSINECNGMRRRSALASLASPSLELC